MNESTSCSLCQRRARPRYSDGKGGWLCHLCRAARAHQNGHRSADPKRILPPASEDAPKTDQDQG